MADVSKLFGTIQSAVHADGEHVIKCIMRTCEEMLQDRGCEVIRRVDDVLAKASDPVPKPVLRGLAADGSGGYAVFLCADGDRVGVRYARAVLEKNEEESLKPIIVSVMGPTFFTRKECDGIQFFTARELCFNVTKHALVPCHRAVANPGVDAALLPKLSITDPVVRYHDWPQGTIVHIRRVFGGHEPSTYFRVVE